MFKLCQLVRPIPDYCPDAVRTLRGCLLRKAKRLISFRRDLSSPDILAAPPCLLRLLQIKVADFSNFPFFAVVLVFAVLVFAVFVPHLSALDILHRPLYSGCYPRQ